ncbi:MAG: NAD(P)H-dependent oxidoreductase [Oligoflexales bacterium]|nr:NAD(P)H-dependent oxidoreductase [Oligoflexales bacterium]
MSDLRIVVICGSVRSGSMTKRAMKVIVEELKASGSDVDVIDPTGYKVPALGEPFSKELRSDLETRIKQADGVIMCTPEYNGCFSYVLMAVIENLGYPSALAGKPIALLGVASGAIGAVKALEHLKGVCSHLGSLVLPGSISIAEVHNQFNDKDELIDAKVDKQIRSVPRELLTYLKRG